MWVSEFTRNGLDILSWVHWMDRTWAKFDMWSFMEVALLLIKVPLEAIWLLVWALNKIAVPFVSATNHKMSI